MENAIKKKCNRSTDLRVATARTT